MKSEKSISVEIICNKFFDLEDAYGLLDLEVRGVKIWQYLRMPVYYQVAKQSGVLDDPHPFKPSLLGWVKIGFSLLNGFIFHNPFVLKGPTDYLLVDHHRSKKIDGEWVDIYTHDFLAMKEANGESGFVLEQPHNGLHLRRLNKSRRTLDMILLAGLVSQRLKPYRPTVSEREKLEQINDAFQEKFGFDIGIPALFCGSVSRFHTRKKLYSKLLKNIRPKELIVLVSYGYLGDLICAAKELGIPVSEIQHGVISRYHLGYSYPGRRDSADYFPDKLLTWGSYWTGIPELPLSPEQLEIIGFAYFHQMRKYYTAVKRQPKRILVLSQGGIGRLLAEKVENLVNQGEGYEWLYKLHPSEYDYWREYPALLSLSNRPNVTLLDHDVDLYQLFAESEFQMGVFSTAIFEGIGMGCKTVLVDLAGIEYMDRLLESGYAVLYDESVTLEENLNNTETMNPDEMISALFGEKYRSTHR